MYFKILSCLPSFLPISLDFDIKPLFCNQASPKHLKRCDLTRTNCDSDILLWRVESRAFFSVLYSVSATSFCLISSSTSRLKLSLSSFVTGTGVSHNFQLHLYCHLCCRDDCQGKILLSFFLLVCSTFFTFFSLLSLPCNTSLSLSSLLHYSFPLCPPMLTLYLISSSSFLFASYLHSCACIVSSPF